MKNKTPKAKVHQTLDLPGKNRKKNENIISLLIKQPINAQHKINNKNPKNLLWNLLGNQCKLCKVANS